MSDTEILTRILQQITKQNELLQTLVDSINPIYDDGAPGPPIASLLSEISVNTADLAGGKQRPVTAARRDELPFEKGPLTDDDPKPMCEVHAVPMRLNKKGTAYYCTEKAGRGEDRNKNGYCPWFAKPVGDDFDRWQYVT